MTERLSRWVQKDGYEELEGRQYVIQMQPRPAYCDRGSVICFVVAKPDAKLFPGDFDAADGWPRYFMDKERGKLECEDWLKKRGQL